MRHTKISKKRSFPLRISFVNVTKYSVSNGFGHFTRENLNGKLHILCIDIGTKWINIRFLLFLPKRKTWFYASMVSCFWLSIQNSLKRLASWWYLVARSKQCKHQSNLWNLFKVINKDTKTTSMTVCPLLTLNKQRIDWYTELNRLENM